MLKESRPGRETSSTMPEIVIEHSDAEGINNSVIESRDMLPKILAKFSVDSLQSYKSVSKFWLDIIRAQEFIKLHLKNSIKNLKYIIFRLAEDFSGTEVCLMDNNGEIGPIFSFPEVLRSMFPRVVNSIHGLLFMTCDIPDNQLLVWTCNPATHKVHVIPNGRPSAVRPTIGIAFDIKNCEYKVYRFYKDLLKSEEDGYACEVYAPVSKSWRKIGNVKYRPSVSPFSSCNDHLSVDGALYWLSYANDGQREATGPAFIMSISMNNDKFKTIYFPGCREVTQFSFLINLEGRLSLVTVDFPHLLIPNSPAQAHLWLAEDLGQSAWFLKSSFKIHVNGIKNFISVVARESDIFFIIADVKDALHHHIFHVSNSSWTVLDLPKNIYYPSDWNWSVAFPYAESLCPCGGGFDDRFRLIPTARH